MIWGGLRGVVGLVLVLQVVYYDEIDFEIVGIRVSRWLIYCMCGVRLFWDVYIEMLFDNCVVFLVFDLCIIVCDILVYLLSFELFVFLFVGFGLCIGYCVFDFVD